MTPEYLVALNRGPIPRGGSFIEHQASALRDYFNAFPTSRSEREAGAWFFTETNRMLADTFAALGLLLLYELAVRPLVRALMFDQDAPQDAGEGPADAG